MKSTKSSYDAKKLLNRVTTSLKEIIAFCQRTPTSRWLGDGSMPYLLYIAQEGGADRLPTIRTMQWLNYQYLKWSAINVHWNICTEYLHGKRAGGMHRGPGWMWAACMQMAHKMHTSNNVCTLKSLLKFSMQHTHAICGCGMCNMTCAEGFLQVFRLEHELASNGSQFRKNSSFLMLRCLLVGHLVMILTHMTFAFR